MSAWPIVPLGAKVKFLSGGTPRKDEPRFWEGDIPWVSSAEMVQQHVRDTQLHVSEDGAKTGSRLVPPKTVLVVVRGMSLANEFRVAISERDLTFNQDLKALIPDKCLDPMFLFYYLLSQNKAIRDSASEAAHGTKKLDMPVLEQWPIPLPPRALQKKVAAVLSAYDDMIENNKRRIALLGKMAEEIYREWFVRMRFPGHEKVKVVKGVPEGWCAMRFAEICKFEKGKNPAELLYDETEGSLPYINVDTLENKGASYAIKRKNSVVSQEDDVLMLMDGARSGLVFRGNKGIVGSTFSVIRVNPKLRHFIFEYLRATKESIVFNNTGSAIPHASKEFINRMIVFMPQHDDLIDRFNVVYQGLYNKKRNLELKNALLSATKNMVLPRVISGKLSVEKLDIEFPPSMQDEASS
jgi:type I restriction enzyme, S subunit